MNKKPLVSVVVTTKNEEHNIGNCLMSIKRQTYPEIEIIVVDNNSTDKTRQIAFEYTSQVYNYGNERSEQRNFGISIAKGEYILYLDADMDLGMCVVEDCVSLARDDSTISGIYIPEEIEGMGFWIDVRNFERSFYTGTVIDCCRFFPLDIFRETDGFDTSLTGVEDWDLDKHIRSFGNTRIIKSSLYHNEGEFDINKYLGKKSYYIPSIKIYQDKWGKWDKDIRKQTGLWYRFFGVYFEDWKFLKLIRHPLLSVGMYYLRLRVGLLYFRKSKII
jgi:glycosyltransferase involved in cell wall biosynthesis